MHHETPMNAASPIAIGIIAWNEEAAISAMLESLFAQSLFAELAARQMRCEVICIPNGCTDRTADVAREVLERHQREHPWKEAFSARVVEVQKRGKINAWNVFVHELSSREAQFLFLADADIVLSHPQTLWSMYRTLDENTTAIVSTDTPIKDIALKPRRSLMERLSLAASRMTQSATAQLTGQLYCIKASIARNIYLPADLAACEDGFIKSLACTYFLTHEVRPKHIVVAPNASHIFEAYVSPRDILNNQKRQMIGQTIVHLLVDRELKRLPLEQKLNLAETLRAREAADPDWLKRLIADHVCRTRHFWQLFPNLIKSRFDRLKRLPRRKRITHLPVALAGLAVSLLASRRACRALRTGYINYWPDTQSLKLKGLAREDARPPTAAPTAEGRASVPASRGSVSISKTAIQIQE
jgi:glycosyltransferase involved in cell wall biosynthesis